MDDRAEIEILHRDDWTEVFRAVARPKEVWWTDELEGPGYAEFKVSGQDPLLNDGFSEFAMNNIIAVNLNDSRVFASKIDQRVFDEIYVGEDADAWWTVGGAGLKSGLMQAAVFPSGYVPSDGLYRLVMDQRPFTFAALDYDDSAASWTLAVPVKQVAVGTAPFMSQPPGWPDDDAYWVTTPLTAHFGEFATLPDAGLMYFRQTFTLAQNTLVTVFAAAAGQLEVYIDGELGLEAAGTFRVGEWELRLPPGQHQIAARYRPAASAAQPGIVISVGEQTGTSGGEPVYDWITRTNSLWEVLGNVNPPPGFTPGRIMRILVEEFIARADFDGQPAFLRHLGLDFDDDEDSDGNPWSELTDRYWQVGTDVMSVLLELCESACESYITPFGNLKMYAGERGEDKSADVRFEPGKNVLRQSHDTQNGLGNHIIGRYAAGWTQKHRQAMNPSGGLVQRREAFMSVPTADSATEARRLMTTALNNEGGQRRVTTCEIESRPGAVPYTDFQVGDYVSAWDVYEQAFVPQRLVALTCRQDEFGLLRFFPQLVIA